METSGSVKTGDNLTIIANSTDSFLVERNDGTDIFKIDTIADSVLSGLLRPRSNNNYDLGTNSAKWRDVHIGNILYTESIQSNNWDNVSISPSQLNDTVSVSEGGTGATTFPSGRLLLGQGSSAVSTLIIDTDFFTTALSTLSLKNNLGLTNVNFSGNARLFLRLKVERAVVKKSVSIIRVLTALEP